MAEHWIVGLDCELRVVDTPIPLAWQVAGPAGPRAIEVYPAATLRSHELPATRYKKLELRATREEILEGLEARMSLKCERELLLRCDHTLDAAVCVLAGADFLRGECLSPVNPETAEKEGWIWVRDPARPARNGPG